MSPTFLMTSIAENVAPAFTEAGALTDLTTSSDFFAALAGAATISRTTSAPINQPMEARPGVRVMTLTLRESAPLGANDQSPGAQRATRTSQRSGKKRRPTVDCR